MWSCSQTVLKYCADMKEKLSDALNVYVIKRLREKTIQASDETLCTKSFGYSQFHSRFSKCQPWATIFSSEFRLLEAKNLGTRSLKRYLTVYRWKIQKTHKIPRNFFHQESRACSLT